MVMMTEQYQQTQPAATVRTPRRASAWSAGRGDEPQAGEGRGRQVPVSRMLSGNPEWFALAHPQPEGE